jgi:glycosyltransferase involved in cell wall biosynthesis
MLVERDIRSFDVSIILPTRKRVEKLNDTIYSILSLADPNNVNFEIIVKVDFDDVDSIEYIKHWQNDFENITFIINSRRGGWLNMADYVENMIDISKSDWILNINDDMLFKTPNWNNILKKYLTDFKIYFLNTNGYKQSFPVYPKKIKEILGHISLHNQIDTYLYTLSLNTGMEAYIEDVFLEHDLDLRDEIHGDKAEVVDRNFATRNFHFTSMDFVNDVNKIKNYINTNKI